MKNLLIFISIVFIPISLFSQNDVCFELEENPYPNHPAFGIFSKYVNVLDCFEIFAPSNISDEKVLHVAAVAAELLDNNEDGNVDNNQAHDKMIENKAFIIMWKDDNDLDIEPPNDRIGQDLGDDETNPNFVINNKNLASISYLLQII